MNRKQVNYLSNSPLFSNMSTVFFSSQYAASDDSSFQLILFNGSMQLVSNSEGFDSQMLQTPGYPQELGDYNITIQVGTRSIFV